MDNTGRNSQDRKTYVEPFVGGWISNRTFGGTLN